MGVEATEAGHLAQAAAQDLVVRDGHDEIGRQRAHLRDEVRFVRPGRPEDRDARFLRGRFEQPVRRAAPEHRARHAMPRPHQAAQRVGRPLAVAEEHHASAASGGDRHPRSAHSSSSSTATSRTTLRPTT